MQWESETVKEEKSVEFATDTTGWKQTQQTQSPWKCLEGPYPHASGACPPTLLSTHSPVCESHQEGEISHKPEQALSTKESCQLPEMERWLSTEELSTMVAAEELWGGSRGNEMILWPQIGL